MKISLEAWDGSSNANTLMEKLLCTKYVTTNPYMVSDEYRQSPAHYVGIVVTYSVSEYSYCYLYL